MPNPTDLNRLVCTKEAARILCCSAAWFERGRCYGYGPPFCRIGRMVRYRLGDLWAYRDAGRIDPSAGPR